METLACLEINKGGSVASLKKTWQELFSPRNDLLGHFVFTSFTRASKLLEVAAPLRTNTVEELQIPELLRTRLCTELNGYSGLESYLEGNEASYSCWAKFSVKEIFRQLRPKRSFTEHHNVAQRLHDKSTTPYGWTWHEMTFIASWSPYDGFVLFCCDVPEDFIIALQASVTTSKIGTHMSNPFDALSLVITQVLNMYDKSVWSLRDHICHWEANRIVEPDYPLLHEIARHIVHVNETLEVALESVGDIDAQQKEFMTKYYPDILAKTKTSHQLQLQTKIMYSLLARSKSNHARLQNEITLAFNSAAQRDAKIQVRIAEEAKREATAMKAIALVTLTFLPATFVSSLFSMSFFSYEPANETNKFTVAKEFWLYWVITAPLTLAALGFWQFWPVVSHRKEKVDEKRGKGTKMSAV